MPAEPKQLRQSSPIATDRERRIRGAIERDSTQSATRWWRLSPDRDRWQQGHGQAVHCPHVAVSFRT